MLAMQYLSAAAFAPTAPLSGSSMSAMASSHSARAAAPAMDLSLAGTIIRDVSALPTMYALMSVNEYMTHRYFQHLEFNRPESLPWLKDALGAIPGVERSELKVPGDGHVEHHAETYDDMSLKNDARWRSNSVAKALDEDAWRGTAFHWSATLIMTVQMMPSVLPTYALMGWSLPETMAILLPSMLVHAIVWNAVHPPMHGLPPVNLAAGFGTAGTTLGEEFTEWLLQTRYAHYIFENHMGHHVLGGQCNYNVCCPMADHLLGTYVPTETWAKKMRPLPVGAETRGAAVNPLGRSVPQVPTREEYEANKQLAKQLKEQRPEVLVGGGAMIADAYSEASEDALLL